MKVAIFIILLLLGNFNLYDMNLHDDAFHNELPLHIETWYFEGIFENNESIVFMLTSLSNGSKGIFMTGAHFYKNGSIVYEKREMYTSFFLSNESPYVIVDGKEILKGFLNNNKICYSLSYSSPNFSFKLYFENKTKGWKSNDWIAIPNMKVKGHICIDGNKRNVEGKGYHDHNIFFLWQPFIERGYMDGKIIMNNYSIVWARLMNSMINHKDFVIFSKSSYMLIKNITIKCFDYKINHGKIIPTSFHIFAKNKNLSIDVSIHAYSIHFIRLPLIRYWRYHVHAIGEIKEKDKTTKINTNDIVEYMLFSF